MNNEYITELFETPPVSFTREVKDISDIAVDYKFTIEDQPTIVNFERSKIHEGLVKLAFTISNYYSGSGVSQFKNIQALYSTVVECIKDYIKEYNDKYPIKEIEFFGFNKKQERFYDALIEVLSQKIGWGYRKEEPYYLFLVNPDYDNEESMEETLKFNAKLLMEVLDSSIEPHEYNKVTLNELFNTPIKTEHNSYVNYEDWTFYLEGKRCEVNFQEREEDKVYSVEFSVNESMSPGNLDDFKSITSLFSTLIECFKEFIAIKPKVETIFFFGASNELNRFYTKVLPVLAKGIGWRHNIFNLGNAGNRFNLTNPNIVDINYEESQAYDKEMITELFEKFVSKDKWEIRDESNVLHYDFNIGNNHVSVGIANVKDNDEYELVFLINDSYLKQGDFSPEETTLLFGTLYQIILDLITKRSVNILFYTGFSESVETFYEKSLSMIGQKLGWEVKAIDKWSGLMNKNKRVFYIINPNYSGKK